MEIGEALDTWEINNRLNLYFLENVPPEQLQTKAEKSKTVAGHLAHIHKVRLMWLKPAAPDLLETMVPLEDESPAALRTALVASGEAMAKLLARSFEAGKVKGFKPHPMGFLGYLIAHEAFHRSQAELVLRQAGTPLSDKVAYGLWEWGVR